jgi:hypothetical protein
MKAPSPHQHTLIKRKLFLRNVIHFEFFCENVQNRPDFVETMSVSICSGGGVEVKVSENELKSVSCHSLREY